MPKASDAFFFQFGQKDRKTERRKDRKTERRIDRNCIYTKTLLDNQNMLSVNQIAAQIKLTEMWKASNDPQYPIKMKTKERQENAVETRSLTRGR